MMPAVSMREAAMLVACLERLAPLHDRLCPRQVLGARMGLLAGDLLQLDLPRADKRVVAFVETDGCLVDGILVSTGCALGHRTMRLVDHGKVAATFVDTVSGRAVRIHPDSAARVRAIAYDPEATSPWHAQLAAYQVMPTSELLRARPVHLTVSMSDLIGRPGERVTCARCGEEILNQRDVERDGLALCRGCTGDRYYVDDEAP